MSVRVRLFARAREAASASEAEVDARTLGELLERIRRDYGPDFGAVLDTSRVWVNGDEPAAGAETELRDGDEVAVLPPVSGGAAAPRDPLRGARASSPRRTEPRRRAS